MRTARLPDSLRSLSALVPPRPRAQPAASGYLRSRSWSNPDASKHRTWLCAANRWLGGSPLTAAALAGAAAEAQHGHGPAEPQAAPPGDHLQPDFRTHFTSLLIKDFALVEEQQVELQPGLTVITGESGSGKSVLVEALGQLLGATAFDEAVRPPADTALLEGTVAVAPSEQPLLHKLLRALGLPQRAVKRLDCLTLRRELSKGPDGSVRSRCFINGSPTSVRVLREVGQALVDVNGQHAALSLKDGAMRLRLLDRLAGTAADADRFAASLAEWQAAREQLRELEALSDEEQREAMQRLVDEVHAARVEPGEDRLLRRQLRQLDSRRAAAERCRLVSVGLSGDGGGGIADALRDVQLQVKQLLSLEERLAAQAAAEREEEEEVGQQGGSPAGGGGEEEGEQSAEGMLLHAVELLDQAQLLLEGAEEQVARYGAQYRFSQAEYDELSQRLQQLERLMKQHDASSADELAEMAEQQSAALDLYFQLEGQRDELEAAAAALLADVQRQAVELSRRRWQAAGQLQEAVQAVLADLAMAGSRFEARMSWTPVAAAAAAGEAGGSSLALSADEAAHCGEEAVPARYKVRPSGLDSAEFLFAAGPAEPLRPLSAVASGGEMARIMLALKAAPALMLAAAVGSSEGSSGSGGGSGGMQESTGASSNKSSGTADGTASSTGSQILILDELDSGIGSRLGQPIGRILRRMAGPQGLRVGQILCVSHLPQVAAHAEHHLCVRKAVGAGDRMITRFDTLQQRPERLAEIGAMLGLPEAAAEELLQAAAQP